MIARSCVSQLRGFPPHSCHFRMFEWDTLSTSFERGSMTTESTCKQAPQTPKYIRFGMTGSGRVYGVFLDADGRERSKLIRTLKPDEALQGASVRDQVLYLHGFAAGFNAGRTKEKKKRNERMATLLREHGYSVLLVAEVFGLSLSWTREILRSEGLFAEDISYDHHSGSAGKPVHPARPKRGRPRRK